MPTLSPGVRAALALLASLLLLSALVSWRNVERLSEDARWVTHTHQVLAATASVSTARERLQGLERAWAASGLEEDRSAMVRGREALDAAIESLRQLTLDDPQQKARVARLIQAAAHAPGSIEPLVVEIAAAEHTLLAERDRQYATTYQTVVATVFVAGLVGLIAVAALAVQFRRHIEARGEVAAQDQRLRVLLGELTEQDQRKNEFLAVLAHELRNPLAPLRTGLEILNRVSSAEPLAVSARQMMDRQLTHMVRLIDELLDISRISRGKIELHRQLVRVADVLRQAVETNRPLMEAQGHALQLPPPEAVADLWIDADAVRMAQVFGNLLNNAAKYTNAGGAIRVGVETDEGRVRVIVGDNGVGIPPGMLERIFEIFTQVERSNEAGRGGLGIGLSLVRTLVQMHGGQVEARSAGEGRGSEFVVTLPLARAPRPEATPAPAAAAPVQAAALDVLVADDSADIAESVAQFVSLLGHRAQVVHDGEQAVAAVRARAPDVVLLDIGMPRMDGLEACRRIRCIPVDRPMLVVAMTGWGQEEDIRRSEEAGFDRHLVKPVDPAMLESVLAEWAAGRAGVRA